MSAAQKIALRRCPQRQRASDCVSHNPQPKGVWTYSGNIPEYPVKNKIQDWRIGKMSREKSEKDVRNVTITVRLNEEEHEKLK